MSKKSARPSHRARAPRHAAVERRIHPVLDALEETPITGRHFKVMYQQEGRWHQKYAVGASVERALADARKIDPNAYAVQTS